MPIAALTIWFLLVGAITMVLAQTDPPPHPDDRPGPRLGRFDADGNGVLDTVERAKARQYLRQIRPQRRGRGSGRFNRAPGGSRREPKRGPRVSLSQAKSYADASLYDPTVLRTLFLEFETEDWEAELEDFYRTGVEVPARLTVDGKVYPQVGVRFRGHSSFTRVSSGMKRSLNISIDHGKSKQRLYGYKTVELRNSFADPSFLRVVLFAAIARNYLPSLNANLVKVVINGESWGLYVNSQQFNTDFLVEWFGTRKGVRWKVPVNMDGFGSLAINGDDVADYKPYFQLKTGGAVGAWQRLMKLCQSLNETPTENLETGLDEILNLDRALWFIAIDNVLIDNDGYISRGSDYVLYQDSAGRFHTIPYDSNETLRYPGGPGFRGKGAPGATMSPLIYQNNESRPLIRRLLGHPVLRARYLYHVRIIVEEWLDWQVLGPIVEQYRALIDAELAIDVKMLISYQQFLDSVTPEVGTGHPRLPSLARFVSERRHSLLSHPALDKPWPKIVSVTQNSQQPGTSHSLWVAAKVDGSVPVESMYLYYTTTPNGRFTQVPMESPKKNFYAAVIPSQASWTKVRYYVEARSLERLGTTTFHPSNTEVGALSYVVPGAPDTADAGQQE